MQVDNPTNATFAGRKPNNRHIKNTLSREVTIFAMLLKYRRFVIKVATLYTVPISVIIKLHKIKKNKYFTDGTSSGEMLISFSKFKISGIIITRITGIIDTLATSTDEKYSLASFFLPLWYSTVTPGKFPVC